MKRVSGLSQTLPQQTVIETVLTSIVVECYCINRLHILIVLGRSPVNYVSGGVYTDSIVALPKKYIIEI